MLRREVDWKNEGRIESGPEVRSVAGVARPPEEFVPKPRVAEEPVPEMRPGRWRSAGRRTPRSHYAWYAAFVLVSALLGQWTLLPLVAVAIGVWIRRARHVIGPDDPILLTIVEIADGATPVAVGTDTGVAFLDGDALAWKGERCSFRIGGQDVRAERATFEMSVRPMPDETLDVDARGRRLRLTFGFGKWRRDEWRAIAAWAKRRPVDRGPREAPPHRSPTLPMTGWDGFLSLLMVRVAMALFFFVPIGLLAMRTLLRRAEARAASSLGE